MNKRLPLGRWFGLDLSITPLALLMYAGLALLSLLASAVFARLDALSALWSGLVVAIGMFLSDWLHHYGHSLAARWTGYPMTGMHFYSLFANSLYPPDEPALPAGLHIRRALGGFWVNLLIGLLLGAAANSLGLAGGGLGWATSVLAFLNFFVLGLGALLPLEIKGLAATDGAVILRSLRGGGVP